MRGYIKNGVILLFLSINIFIFIPQVKRSFSKINRLDTSIMGINSQLEGMKERIDEFDEKILDSKIEFYREKIGREKLQMVGEGEKIWYRKMKRVNKK